MHKNSPVDLPTQYALLEKMIRIREFEETVATRYQEQEMRCPVHLSIGQEAPPAGICQVLKKNDMIFSHHRSHGHYVAKGGSLKKVLAEFYGKAAGCSEGIGGSMHLIDTEVGIMACTPIVGGIMPVAVGAAMATKYMGKDTVTTVFLGDATLEEGVVHESMNFASLKKLPLIFFCENNFFSVYTHLRDRQPERSLSDLAKAHAIRCFGADGNDAVAVYQASLEAYNHVKSGAGPAFIEVTTYRWREHCGPNYDNDIGYRTEAEFQEWKKRCPVARMIQHMQAQDSGADSKIEQMYSQARKDIKEAFAFAEAAPFPEQEAMFRNLYAE